MLILHEQEKAYNAIKYFVAHTGMCGKKKLFKLLYALDFEHFAKTGRSVTGYNYHALPMGPVPVELKREIDYSYPGLLEHFEIRTEPAGPFIRECLDPKTPFDPKVFSKRELALLKNVAERFADSNADEMERWTHREGMPWHQIYEVEGKKNDLIPYEYELQHMSKEEREMILEAAEERNALISHYQ